MDTRELEVRNVTYRLFAELGRAPAADEVAQVTQLPQAEIAEAWRRLHDGHALVLDPVTSAIRMAHPFSAVATPHRVHAADRWWYGNCAWDAIGICAALRTDGRVLTSCEDCGETITLRIRGQRVDDERPLFHCLVPAARWWQDIVFT